MDKKNALLGSVFAVAAIACFLWAERHAPQQPNPVAVQQAAAPSSAAGAPGAATGTMPAQPANLPSFAAAVEERKGAAITSLHNSYIQVNFTDAGGSIRNVELTKYPKSLTDRTPFILNELHKDPIAAFVNLPGLDDGTAYQLVSHTDHDVVYRTVWNKQLEVTRHFIVSPDQVGKTDPYEVQVETTFRNLTGGVVNVPVLQVALGTAPPTSLNDTGRYLTCEYDANGKTSNIPRSKLEAGSGVAGIGAHDAQAEIQTQGPLQWAGVSNQFFVSLYTPDKPAVGLVTRRVRLLPKEPETSPNAYGITADAIFNLPPIEAQGTAKLAGNFYVGAKEYTRISNTDIYKNDQSEIMHFGWFKLFAALELTIMVWMHSLAANWGVAIILTTLLLKLVFVPFTLAQARNARRMQKLQPQMTALKEKYKDNPQKQQMAQMELFKANKVNPLSGCLPMLITIPFFWGFYRMLDSSAQLRFASFLWAQDLSSPDTIARLPLGHFASVPINPLPILFVGAMFLQMQFAPQPTVDNSQAKMMRYMPFLFLFIYYGYSCALSLYSLVNALFTIVQQMVINRTTDTEVPAPVGVSGKALKNVTPKRR